MYLIRLDDASERRDIAKWNRIEDLLDSYQLKPLVGVIPDNQDQELSVYPAEDHFWDRVRNWEKKGWVIAVHGYQHRFVSEEGGINPVNRYSEFAGLPLAEQKEKIKKAVSIFQRNGIEPKVFFAPAHTFDRNTLQALREESNIRILSDTVSNKPYCMDGFTFIPQQSGRVRKLPFHTVTFCYHPNLMSEEDFSELETFIRKNRKKFADYQAKTTARKEGLTDRFLHKLYFYRRK